MISSTAKPGIPSRIRDAVESQPGLTDRELADRILGTTAHPSQINQECRLMASRGLLRRLPRADGRIGNYPHGEVPEKSSPLPDPKTLRQADDSGLSEDAIKKHIAHWLEQASWSVEVAWGKARGIDITARRNDATWIIEAKGCGTLQPMRVNYFLAILGETLQRMSDQQAKYSIALPDLAQFRGLWHRLPALAKSRTGITALFVSALGEVEEAS
jgi:hypothetical protein